MLLAGLVILFRAVLFQPEQVVFSNDGPLGQMMTEQVKLPAALTGLWADQNGLGLASAKPDLDVTTGLRLLLSPLWFAKLYPAIAAAFCGLGCWFCFRRWQFHPAVATFGAVAAAFNGDFLGTAGWGVASQTISFGFAFFAFGLLAEQSGVRWRRLTLAGLCIGLTVCEAFDIGALFALLLASAGVSSGLIARAGCWRTVRDLALVTAAAALIAAGTLQTLVGTQVQGISGMSQDADTKAARWAEATAASLSPVDSLDVLIPGLFGWRDGYWGSPGGMGSHYCGSFVLLGVLLAVRGRFAKNHLPPAHRQWVTFFILVAVVCTGLMWGRHAPFYQWFYALPFASTMRNPAKFLHLLEWVLILLSGFGWNSLLVRAQAAPVCGGLWRAISLRLLSGLAGVWIGYALWAAGQNQIPKDLLNLSLGRAVLAWFYLAGALGLGWLIQTGRFSGHRARWLPLVFALGVGLELLPPGRHWITTWNWSEKYVAASANPVIDHLRSHQLDRVSVLPAWLAAAVRQNPAPTQLLQQVYHLEWLQHVLPFNNVATLDFIQLPRPPLDIVEFETAFQFQGTPATAGRVVRRWELTSTRFLLGDAALVPVVNQALDGGRVRFMVRLLFEFYQMRPSGPILTRTNASGPFALIEFTGALPRAQLYPTFQVRQSDTTEALNTLAAPEFDPAKNLLVAGAALPPSTGSGGGAVTITSYAPKSISLKAHSPAECVLRLTDRFDPRWHVTVDGRPATLLRVNYNQRGVALPPGEHEVEFRYVTHPAGLAGNALGLLLLGALLLRPD